MTDSSSHSHAPRSAASPCPSSVSCGPSRWSSRGSRPHRRSGAAAERRGDAGRSAGRIVRRRASSRTLAPRSRCGTEIAGLLERVTVKEKEAVRRGQAPGRAARRRRAGRDRRGARPRRRGRGRHPPRRERHPDRLLAADRPGGRAAQPSSSARSATSPQPQARRATAEAAIVRLEAKLAKSRIVAPLDGVVLSRGVDPGETVEAGAPLFSLGDLSRTRIEAEIDEFDAGRVRLGAAVTVTAEGLDGQSWQGQVEEIPDQVVPRRTRPQDPGRPSDTRVLLVKIALAGPTPLRLGQRVEIVIGGQVAVAARAADSPVASPREPGR